MSLPARMPEPDGVPDNVRQLHPHRSRFAEWPITLVLASVFLSLGTVAFDHFRRGAVLFSFAFVLAFFLRLLLPESDAGLLAIRSRRIDLVVLGILSLAVSVLSLVVPPPS